ncbi:TIM-barrel fold metal-dependent hydrolase [Arthrobacter crystallopoietes BAB-32]|uniref:TIM-barrel fold metal-dependent hydrolase n=1 Tax=Arthrobacter crystallopoietes BAB-32 TaxID=1246476 RepID=N1V2M1_9MICC|nr:amidohydrolase family protein [Arthrobacter crystallopoietes]EMY35600.1 TIM-barrel fold metal-dependent hydrolase [Arthrobacter crystallopoietes BAB-32]
MNDAGPQRGNRVTLYRNGSVYSPADPYATAMVVEGDTVAWIGSEQAADSIADASMEIFDLDGRLVAPGFVDSHTHTTDKGLALRTLDLSGAASLAELLEEVAGAAKTNDVVLGHGWDETRWPENRAPTAAELERAAGGKDVFLNRIDVHSAAVSASLAVRAEVTELEGWDGAGIVRTQAHAAARRTAQTMTTAVRREVQRAALSHAASRGYVALAEMAAPQIVPAEDLLGLLQLAEDERESLPKILPYWGQLVSSAEELRALLDGFGGRLRGLAGDLNIDGSIGSRTACVHGGYSDRPSESGELFLSVEQATEHVAHCSAVGVQGGFHVIGDAGLERALLAFAGAAERVGLETVRRARHRLEHVEMLPPGAVEQLLHFGITASMQPLFDAYWGGQSGMYAERLGSERALAMNAVGTLQTAGVPVCLGSDAPVTEQSPWAAVKACLEHNNPAERISARAAFLAHTRAGWRAANERNPMQGQLAPGTPATFAVWDVDELSVQTPDSRVSAWSTDARAGTPLLPSLDTGRLPECLRTVVEGRTIFDAQA